MYILVPVLDNLQLSSNESSIYLPKQCFSPNRRGPPPGFLQLDTTVGRS